MAKNEKTSRPVAKKASKALRKGKASKKDTRSIAGSALSQTPDKKKATKRGK